MSSIIPIYTAENCRAAYQLDWALSLFANQPLPDHAHWLDELRTLTECDGVRILEFRFASERVLLFLISSLPQVTPSKVVRSVKGRLQHAIRASVPQAFRRNYRLESVGSAKQNVIEAYVAKQPERHPMADPRVQQAILAVQIENRHVDLSAIRYSAHGQFIHNLHVVLESDWRETAAERFEATRDMLQQASDKHGFLLSRAGIVADHLHMTLGCGMDDSPQAVALSFMNNLAFTYGMKAILKFGFYVGTFGTFDLGAIWEAHRKA